MTDREELERENRRLARRLQRSQGKLVMLEQVQEQNASVMRSLMSDLEQERARSERLLLNILPAPIAEQLKAEPGVIAERYESASVMFVDIVGFTPLSEQLTATEMVEWLNEVYSSFDALVQQSGAEKIRTVGDGYMVAAGVPDRRPDHASVLVGLALGIRDYFSSRPPIAGQTPELRIGINSGELVGGVIGTHKFQYDLWGDVVNVAARMESHGVAGMIQISADTHVLVRDQFICTLRGDLEVKGKGTMRTWFVEGRK